VRGKKKGKKERQNAGKKDSPNDKLTLKRVNRKSHPTRGGKEKYGEAEEGVGGGAGLVIEVMVADRLE